MGKDTNAKIEAALAKYVFNVQPGFVQVQGGLGQSSTFNHQSVVVYKAYGPVTTGTSVSCVWGVSFLMS